MLNKALNIAVLLTCYNRRENTLRCLKSLFDQKDIKSVLNLKVFLVDDGSTDNTAGAVKESYPLVNIINGTGSLFWNRGMHLAWVAAMQQEKFDYYVWLNDDTVLKDCAINELLECQNAKQNRAVVCGAITSFKSERFTYGGRSRDGKELLPNGLIQDCYTINGNCVMISKAVCDAIGILDPTYPHAIGDYEYGLRALKAGFEVVTTPDYIAYCERNDSLPKWCYGSTPIKERLKALYSPLGNSHPQYFFYFEKKYYGLTTAIKHYLTIHLRAIIPSLWK